MRKLESDLTDLLELADVIASRPSVVDGTGILMHHGQWSGIPWWAQNVLDDALAEVERFTGLKTRHVMVNVMPPGTTSGVHVDPEPRDAAGEPQRFQRWHLPLRTNPAALFWCGDDAPQHLESGFWHGPVEYWKPHAVANWGDVARMHLIVDLS